MLGFRGMKTPTITEADIESLARLSKLAITPEEKKAFTGEIESILTYISEIQSVAGELPEHVVGSVKNVLREDTSPHESGLHTETLLNMAPKRKGEYVLVKKILG